MRGYAWVLKEQRLEEELKERKEVIKEMATRKPVKGKGSKKKGY